MHTWRLLKTEPTDGFYNMAVDEAIMQQHSKGKVPPTLRFYSWEPAALSLGYFQRLETEIDEDACQQAGIDIVRRLTGGRAILHDKELTYSITLREDYDLLSSSIVVSYREISEGLVAGLKKLNIPVQLKPRGKGKSPQGNSAACFDAPSWYEVILQGRKLIGSAQTRKNSTILQHGSLPYALDPIKTFKLFNYTSTRARKKARRLFSASSTSLAAAGYEVAPVRLEDALAQGLSDKLNIKLEPAPLTQAEIILADQLKKEKYNTEKWNKKR
ncbi:MAG: lipoate--protein ligase family protein [Bacillota bacterium]